MKIHSDYSSLRFEHFQKLEYIIIIIRCSVERRTHIYHGKYSCSNKIANGIEFNFSFQEK